MGRTSSPFAPLLSFKRTKNARLLLGLRIVTRVTSSSPFFSVRIEVASLTFGNWRSAVKSVGDAIGVVYQFDFVQSIVSGVVDIQYKFEPTVSPSSFCSVSFRK